MKNKPELIDRARQSINKSFYKSKRFWIESLGIDGSYYGSYQLVDESFLDTENYSCYESGYETDYAPAFLLHDYRHVPVWKYYDLYNELEINNNRGLVNIKEKHIIDILKKHGIEI